MVVTRRQSTTPMPAVASRTNSSAGSSRLGKAKAVDKNPPTKESGAGPSRNTPNGTPSKPPLVGPEKLEDIVFEDVPQTSPPPANIAPQKPKSKSKSRKPKVKKQRQNKGISIFDIVARIFLLWLTIYTIAVCPEDVELRSPVCRALTEYRRLVLEPYVYPPVRAALEHPSIAPTVQRIEPYYNFAVKTTTPIIRRSKYEWRTRVIPQVRWLQIRARPYIRQAQRKYDATLGPYVQRVLLEYHIKVEPHVKSLEVTAYQKWKAMRPYVRPLWRGAQHLPGLVIREVAKPLGDARRRWVDPHVAKIWDAVMEQEKANVSKVRTSAESISSQVTVTATGWTPFSASTTTGEDGLTATDDVSSVLPPTPELSREVDPSATLDGTDVTSISGSTPSVLDDIEALVGIASLGEATLPAITDEPAASAVTVMEESLFPTTTMVEAVAETAVVSEDDEGLDDFLSEINAMEPEPEVQPEPILRPEPPSYVDETPEQLEERIRRKSIEVAEKRADIEGRHTQWEIDLENFGNAQIEVVETALSQLRKASVAEAQNPGSAVRSEVEALTKEAEKSLKSLKAYAKKLAAEGTTEAEKVKTWNDIVSKVDKKFGLKVDAAAEAVRAWWDFQIQKELQKIQAISLEVQQIALDAQADLGMDYAWLGDVTYLDWQRYHKLIADANSFEKLYLGIQNGTDGNVPPNPLSEVMEALQMEVDEMIDGFETTLSMVRRDALDLFAGSDKTTSDMAGEVPEVSILPIEPPLGKADGIPPVILSRGAEEVEAAIKRAEEFTTAANHEEL